MQHQRMVVGIVDKRAAVRTHDHVDGNGDRVHHGFDQTDARREPALAHRGDEFETVSARLRGEPRVGNGSGNDFEQNGHERNRVSLKTT